MKKLNNIALWATLSLFSLSSCSDDLGLKVDTPDPSEGITLMIPIISDSAFENTRADATTSKVLTDEGTIKNLYLYVFEKQSDGSFQIVPEYQGKNILSDLKNGNDPASDLLSYRQYSLSLQPGTYKFYLLGNVDKYIGTQDLTSLSTINRIESLNLSFSGPIDLSAQDNGGLPMACMSAIQKSSSEPTTSASNNKEVEITSSTSENIYCDMTFLVSKVRYTILFDNTQENGSTQAGVSYAFGNHIADFTGVTASNIANSVNVKQTLGESTTYNSGTAEGPLTRYAYPTGDYPDFSNGNSANLSSTTNDKNKCAWQGILYLPENTNTGKKTTLNFSGSCKNSSTDETQIYPISKEIELIPPHNTSCADGSNHGIKRGTFYDMKFTVTSFDAVEVNVEEFEWTYQAIAVDMVHTYLEIGATEVSITSEAPAIITYATDGRTDLKKSFICENPTTLEWAAGGKISDPVVIITDVNTVDHTLTFSANPDIDITKVKTGATKGAATCYVVAGNIKKQVKVNYDLSPYFEISPSEVIIQLVKDENGNVSYEEATKVFTYSTNLGGVKLTSRNNTSNIYINGTSGNIKTTSTSTISGSTISISCDNPANGTGTITVKATTTPGASQTHYFAAYPVSQPEDKQFREPISVTVVPPNGPYTIYFRAINDYQDAGNGEFLKGDYATNWNDEGTKDWTDWWSGDNNSSSAKNNHRIYIYGQEGETINTSDQVTSWHFTGEPGDDGKQWYNTSEGMDPSDYSGWYVSTLPYNDGAKDDDTRKPEPGKTLMIFFAHRSNGAGYEVHRAPHHMDAGITLFDYEDREGWILYDPTREPYFKIYDSQPEIEDVTYTLYTTKKVTGWWKEYGMAENNTSYWDHKQYKMHYDFSKESSTERTTVTGSGGTTWHKTTIKLKAAKGDYEKAIMIGGIHKDMVEIPQRVYLEIRKDGNQWETPRAYFYTSSKNIGWNNAITMTKHEKQRDGHNVYYCDVPSGYENGYVIFRGNTNNNSLQIPGQNDGDKYPINGKSKITQNDNMNYWDDYYPDSSNDPGVMLFGGRGFSTNNFTGYYNGSGWTRGRPSGVTQ